MANMTFSSVFPLYLAKVNRKGRKREELLEVIEWLTGFDEKEILRSIEEDLTFAEFFAGAKLHPDASRITGLICEYRVEEISNPLTRQIRCLDKLVDELAKGKKMEKILRKN